MGIVIGIIGGILLFFLLVGWTSKTKNNRLEEEINAEEEANLMQIALPLEKKLRNAIYDCERNIAQCNREIKKICAEQLDLLKDIGRISHIPVKDKALFFEYHNPVENQRHFYYERDLSKKITPEVLEDTKKLAKKYASQIDLLLTQQDLFEKLIESHQENIDRINGVKNQHSQIQKINEHKEKLAALDQDSSLEEKAIYNKLIITDIQEELEHQEECMRQYIELNQKYDNPINNELKEKFQIEIKELIQQLENDADSSK